MQDLLLFINHHLAMFSVLAIVLILLIIIETIKLKNASTRLTPAQVITLVNHQKGVIIDIRSSEAFATGNITGAISLPKNDIKTKIKKIESFKSRPLVIVCATGSDSSGVAAQLAQQGFQVHILNGGIRAWRNAEMPLIKG